MDIQELIKKQKEQPKQSNTAQVIIGDELVPIKIYKTQGLKWAEITYKNPPRAGSRIDTNLGYNAHGAAIAACKESGVILEGEKEMKLSPEKWDELFSVLDSEDVEGISTIIWGLQIVDPRTKKVELLKKAQASQPAKKRRSRSA